MSMGMTLAFSMLELALSLWVEGRSVQWILAVTSGAKFVGLMRSEDSICPQWVLGCELNQSRS